MLDKKAAPKASRAFPGLKGMDLAKVVTTKDPYEWTEGLWVRGEGYRKNIPGRFADGIEARAAVQGRIDRALRSLPTTTASSAIFLAYAR